MSLIKDASLNYLNTFLSFFVNLGLAIMISRSLGPSNMGTFSFIYWVIGTLMLVFTLGLPNTVIKYTAFFESKPDENKSFFRFVFLSSIFLPIIAIFIIQILANLYDINFSVNTWLISLNIAGLILFNLQSALLQGLRQFKTLLKINIGVLIMTAILTFLVINTDRSIHWLLIVSFLSTFFGCVLLLSNTYERFKKSQKNYAIFKNKDILKFFLTTSAIVLLDAIIWQRSEVFFLKIFSYPEEVAFYALAFGISSKVATVFSGSIGTTLLPIFSGLSGLDNKNGLDNLNYKTTSILIIILAPIFFGLIVLLPELVTLLFGNQYIPMIPILSILLLTSFFGAISSSGSSYLYAGNHLSFMLKFGFFIALINIIGGIILIPQFHAIGAAFANGISQLLAVGLTLVYFKYKSKTKFPYLVLIKVLFLCLFMGLLIFQVDTMHINNILLIIVKIILGILIYLSGLILLKLIKNEDIKMLTNKFLLRQKI